SSRRRHTRFSRDWSSDVCSSDLIIRVRELSTRRHHRDGRFGVHGIEGDVDLMHTPVCHQAASVIPEPSEVEVKAILVEGALRCRSEERREGKEGIKMVNGG